MSKKFIRMTSAWIPTSLLLMFAAALVTAQAGPNLPRKQGETPQPPLTVGMRYNGHAVASPGSLQLLFDSALLRPVTIAGRKVPAVLARHAGHKNR